MERTHCSPLNHHRVTIDFSRSGWKQLGRVNTLLAASFLRGFILRRELAEYIAAHEENGIHLDTECQELRYDERIVLLLKKVQGIWYITDVFMIAEPDGFAPVYIWERIKRGCDYVLAHILVGWRMLIHHGCAAEYQL